MSTAGTEVSPRCPRCATIIRREREACPCCGTELAGVELVLMMEHPTAGGSESSSSSRGAPVRAKDGITLCPICMASVPSEELVDYSGQQLCSACASTMQAGNEAKNAPPSGEEPSS